MLRETLENLLCFSSAEKHTRNVLVVERLMAATGHHQDMVPIGVAGRVHDSQR